MDDAGGEPGRGLIEEEEAGSAHQGPADRHHLLLTSREESGPPSEQRGEAGKNGEHSGKAADPFCRRRAAGAELEMVAHGEFGKEPPPGWTIAKPALHPRGRGKGRDLLTGETDMPGHERDLAHHRPQSGRLPCPIGPDDGHALARQEGERHIADHGETSIARAHSFDGKERLLPHAAASSRSGPR
jgi:hypothetical protein